MKQRQLTNWGAAKIGLLLSAGVAFLFLIIWPASRYFTIFGTNAVMVVLAFGSRAPDWAGFSRELGKEPG
jgi:uncharacterized membrane protein